MAGRSSPASVRPSTRTLLRFGWIGPVSFWVLGAAAAVTWPGYDPVARSISSLVHAPLGGLQVLAFAFGAPAALAWAVGAGRMIGATARDRGAVRAVFVVQALLAAAFAVLPTDAAGAPETLTGSLHMATFFVYAVAMPITLVIVGRACTGDPAWRPAARPTFVAAALVLIATLIVPLAVAGPLEPWIGLLERIYVGIPGAWQASLAVRALRLGGGDRGR